MSWEDAWREGRTGWDAGASPPALIELVEAGVLPVGRALVPGCGAGYDVLTLASDEREVIGLDLAETAVARFRALREERGVPEARARVIRSAASDGMPTPAEARSAGASVGSPSRSGATNVIAGDFFRYEPDAPFDLIWDYTFLCAIDESQRAEWAAKVDALLAPDGELAMLVFPATEEPPFGKGPPFALPVREVRALLEPRFTAIQLEPARRSHPGREGMEHVARWRRTSER